MERYGMRLSEIVEVAVRVLREERIDYLDLAPWDVAKVAGATRLTVAGDFGKPLRPQGVSADTRRRISQPCRRGAIRGQ